MSMCIHRAPGQISGRMMCREKERMGPCAWYRAAWCVPWDVVKCVCEKIADMFFPPED